MKMKAIFIVLNAVLGVGVPRDLSSRPLFLLGGDWFTLFWTRNWPIAIVFVVTLGAVDTYFLLNWRLFQGLEKEDWASVAGTLEHRIFRGGPVMASNVRILLNTYLVTSNTDGILALEAYLAEKEDQPDPAIQPRLRHPPPAFEGARRTRRPFSEGF